MGIKISKNSSFKVNETNITNSNIYIIYSIKIIWFWISIQFSLKPIYNFQSSHTRSLYFQIYHITFKTQ